jgi:hypothetical protein
MVVLLLSYVLYQLSDNDTRLRQLESQAAATAAAAAAHKPMKGSSDQLITTSRQSIHDKPAEPEVKPIPQLNSRTDIAQLLESEGLTTGAELGVLVRILPAGRAVVNRLHATCNLLTRTLCHLPRHAGRRLC